jgi:hypothetical protein
MRRSAANLASEPKNKLTSEAHMNAGTVAKVISMIPERTVRVQSGAVFMLEATGCQYAGRLAHVSKFLNWMSPLDSLSKDDQRELGLLSPNGRPTHVSDDEDGTELDALDAEADVDTEADADTEADDSAWDAPRGPAELPAAV